MTGGATSFPAPGSHPPPEALLGPSEADVAVGLLATRKSWGWYLSWRALGPPLIADGEDQAHGSPGGSRPKQIYQVRTPATSPGNPATRQASNSLQKCETRVGFRTLAGVG